MSDHVKSSPHATEIFRDGKEDGDKQSGKAWNLKRNLKDKIVRREENIVSKDAKANG